jgi:hypothetical protein
MDIPNYQYIKNILQHLINSQWSFSQKKILQLRLKICLCLIL